MEEKNEKIKIIIFRLDDVKAWLDNNDMEDAVERVKESGIMYSRYACSNVAIKGIIVNVDEQLLKEVLKRDFTTDLTVKEFKTFWWQKEHDWEEQDRKRKKEEDEWFEKQQQKED